MNLCHWVSVGCSITLGGLGGIVLPVHAETTPVNVVIDAELAPSFESLLLQAELAADSLVNGVFTQQPTVTEVVVNVAGERYGQIVPILVANVTRANWNNTHEIHFWMQNLGAPAVLLGFVKPQGAQTAQAAEDPGTVPRWGRNNTSDHED